MPEPREYIPLTEPIPIVGYSGEQVGWIQPEPKDAPDLFEPIKAIRRADGGLIGDDYLWVNDWMEVADEGDGVFVEMTLTPTEVTRRQYHAGREVLLGSDAACQCPPLLCLGDATPCCLICEDATECPSRPTIEEVLRP